MKIKVFSIEMVLILFLLLIGIHLYNTRDTYSADDYYVSINDSEFGNWSAKCIIIKTDYRGKEGLAPLIFDDNCTRDIRNLHKGDLPSLELSYWSKELTQENLPPYVKKF